MSVKGSWSRVDDQKAYGDTLDEIQAQTKKDRLAKALAVTGGKVKQEKRRDS